MAQRRAAFGFRHAGEAMGRWVADRWGGAIVGTFESGKGLSGPVGRALVDAFVVDRLMGAIWPSFLVLFVVFGLHLAHSLIQAPEAERILLGLTVAGVLAWWAYECVLGARAAWPHLRLWLATGLSPVRHARLLLFEEIRARHRGVTEQLDGVFADVLSTAIDTLQERLKLTPERAAFALANHLAPILVRHLAARLGLIVAPIAIALLYYRFAIYPELVQQNVGIGPWWIALYPFAALIDVLAGSQLRQGLAGV